MHEGFLCTGWFLPICILLSVWVYLWCWQQRMSVKTELMEDSVFGNVSAHTPWTVIHKCIICCYNNTSRQNCTLHHMWPLQLQSLITWTTNNAYCSSLYTDEPHEMCIMSCYNNYITVLYICASFRPYVSDMWAPTFLLVIIKQ